MAAPANVSATALDPLLERAFAALDASGAPWCVLRGEDQLERPPHDVDLLVAAGGIRRVASELAAVGFAPLPLRSRHRMFAAYDRAEDRWLVLDVVTELAYGKPPTFRLPVAAEVLERRVRLDGIPLLELEDRFWTELLHVALDREDVPLPASHRLATLAEQIGSSSSGPVAACIAEALGPATAQRLLELAARGDWETLRAFAAAGAASRPVRRPPGAAFVHRLRGRLGRRGVSVALVGPDGAGKSSVAAGIGDETPLRSRRLYMGLQPGASIPGKTWTPPAGAAARRRRRPLPLRLARQWRRLFRLGRRSLAARLALAGGQLVIFDRYAYDAEVHWENADGLGGRLRRWLIRRAVIRPDVVVFLDVPGEITFARKREHSPELLELRRQRYLELAARLGHAHVVDGTQSPDEVRAEVTDLVWSAYARKHGRRRRAFRGR
jgi:thymidylate kinase